MDVSPQWLDVAPLLWKDAEAANLDSIFRHNKTSFVQSNQARGLGCTRTGPHIGTPSLQWMTISTGLAHFVHKIKTNYEPTLCSERGVFWTTPRIIWNGNHITEGGNRRIGVDG